MSVLPVSADYPIHTPHAELIRDEAHALAVARRVAAVLLEQDAERDRTRQVPAEVVDLYSNSGLWGISVPREVGGAQVSYAVLAQVIAIISAADPSLGQIPQNHYCLLEDIRLQGTPEQQAYFFGLALEGHRFANALSETGGKNVQDIQATIRRQGDGYVINGRKG
ncbi:MAG: acyl-CoA dehydrogenase family protein, partial [Pseudomonas sp.]